MVSWRFRVVVKVPMISGIRERKETLAVCIGSDVDGCRLKKIE